MPVPLGLPPGIRCKRCGYMEAFLQRQSDVMPDPRPCPRCGNNEYLLNKPTYGHWMLDVARGTNDGNGGGVMIKTGVSPALPSLRAPAEQSRDGEVPTVGAKHLEIASSLRSSQ